MPRPNLFTYRDHRAFLADWLDARRAEDPSYSLAVFARDGGCSRSAVVNVISGARMPKPASVAAFAQAMGLTPPEHTFLRLLVELASAPTVHARREVMSRILASERYEQLRLGENERQEDVARYLEHWYIPAIRELATLPGFRPDPDWIAARMVPPIDAAEAATALQTLFDLGFLQRRPDGTVQPRDIRFGTATETAVRAVARFHREEVAGMLARVDPSQHRVQHLRTMTLALDEDHLDEVKSKIDALIQQIADLADAGTVDRSGRVYQLSVQLVPLTAPADPPGQGPSTAD